jgi:predicted  nucleic acid-binding Zn-ribbon protein
MREGIRLLRRSKSKRWSIAAVLGVMLLLAGALYPDAARSQDADNGSEALVTPERMMASLASALTGQQDDLAKLKVQLQQLDALRKSVQAEIDAYHSQDAAHSQLLLVPQVRIEDLENALKNNRLAQGTLKERIETFQERWESTEILLKEVSERIALARTQVADTKQAKFPADQQQKLVAATRKLLQVLEEKKELGERYLKICGELLDQLKGAQTEKVTIGEKLVTQYESRQKSALYTRSDPFQRLSVEVLAEELRFFGKKAGAVFNPGAWQAKWGQIKMGGFTRWLSFLAILSAILALQGRCGNFLRKVEDKLEGPERYYRRLEVYMLRHSLLYLGMTLAFGLYSSLQFALLNIGLGRFLFYVFLFLLLIRWGLDYLKHGSRRSPTRLRTYVSWHLKRFFRVFRVSAIISLILIWIIGRNSLLSWSVGNLFTVAYLAWAWIFWRRIKPVVGALKDSILTMLLAGRAILNGSWGLGLSYLAWGLGPQHPGRQRHFPGGGLRGAEYRHRIRAAEYFQQFYQRPDPAFRAAHPGGGYSWKSTVSGPRSSRSTCAPPWCRPSTMLR